MKQCLNCGRFFQPKEFGQAQCEICRAAERQKFPPEPIDLVGLGIVDQATYDRLRLAE
jgi:hypothetical protein